MNQRTKATNISQATKKKVYERDDGLCVLCGRPGLPEAHVVPRSQGGLGIEQNIVTLCRECHRKFDQTDYHDKAYEIITKYMRKHYPDWDESAVVYKKYGGLL